MKFSPGVDFGKEVENKVQSAISKNLQGYMDDRLAFGCWKQDENGDQLAIVSIPITIVIKEDGSEKWYYPTQNK